MEKVKRVSVLECPVDVLSFSQTIGLIDAAVREDRCINFAVLNVDMVMKAKRDKQFSDLLWRADYVFADGMPIVWAASLLGNPILGRVPGTDVVWECARISADLGCGVALIGAMPGVADRAAEKMRIHHPGAMIHPIPTPFPLDHGASLKIVQIIKDVNAKILLVALGAPRQEQWIDFYLKATSANVGIGIGSAFDIICGDQPHAPKWMRRNGLEWLHRMMLDPKRLGRRYLLEDSPFLFHLVLAAIKKAKYERNIR